MSALGLSSAKHTEFEVSLGYLKNKLRKKKRKETSPQPVPAMGVPVPSEGASQNPAGMKRQGRYVEESSVDPDLHFCANFPRPGSPQK